ncbi:MAG: YhgE/Pip domain-containing protein [Olsenella sp.]|nr:YhgE/Pip domain-containing protein [Olsenella sp.]
MENPLRGLRFSLLDFHSARANLGMKIAMLGIVLIPLIYGALYLMAFYDPYGRLDTLPVAVVNEDVPVTTEGGEEVHAGDDLVEALSDSDSLEYHFLDSAEEARAGLDDGTYYNVIEIPEDFSAKVASADGDDPEQAHLVLVCNDANNYLSSILGASVMRQVTAETNYAIGDNYFVEIFDTIDETGGSLGEAADGSRELADGLVDAHDGSAQITDGLSTARTGAGQLADGLGTAADGSGQLEDGLGAARDGSATLADGLDTARTGADQLASGTQQLADGASSARQGSTALVGGLGQLEAGSGRLTNGLSAARDGANALDSGLGRLDVGASSLANGASAVSDGASKLVGAIEAKSGDVSSLQIGADQVADGLSTLSGSLGDLASGAGTARDCANAASGVLGAAKQENGNYVLTPDQMAQLQQYVGGASQAASGVADGASQAAGSAGQLAAGAAQVSGGVYEVASGLSQLHEAAKQLADGASGVADGAKGVAEGVSSAKEGAGSLASGVSDAYDGSSAITSNLGTAKAGAQSLDAGIGQLSDGLAAGVAGSSQLAGGIAQLSGGAGTLRAGLDRLYLGSDALTGGLRTALDGSNQLVGGLDELHDGSATLTDGLGDAVEGSEELADGLADGVEKIDDATEGADGRADMMSEPVVLDQEHVTTVDNYGSGFAPYFIALGLWVGALVLTFLLRPFNNRLVTAGANPMTVAFSGLVPWLLVGLAQAVLLAFTIQYPCGIAVAHPVAYYALAILASFVFCAIIQMITATFGFPGKFLAVVLLMLQLTTAAGTFPIETEFTIFQKMSPWLPMTYIVHGLRQAMAGADLSLVGGDVACLLAFMAAAFGITCLVAWRKRLVTPNDLHPLIDL